MSVSWYEVINKELFSANDRSIVILGCAMIEVKLRELIKVNLLHPFEKNDGLFGRSKPLDTFSSNIDLAYRMGVFDFHIRDSLHTLRKIRNDCAHVTDHISLQEPPHRDRLDSIRRKLSVWRCDESLSHRDLAVHACMKFIGTFDNAKIDVETNTKNNKVPFGAYLFVKDGNLSSSTYTKQHHPSVWLHSASDSKK